VSRMNGTTRKKAYVLLINRDGEFCKFCDRKPDQMQLVIDHVDNDNSNNHTDNWQLLCRRCNFIKHRRPVDKCVSENEVASDTTELQESRLKEPKFRRYVAHRINEEGKVTEEDLINSGAEEIENSPVTTKRYLNKMCSSVGIYQRKHVGKTVVIAYKKYLSVCIPNITSARITIDSIKPKIRKI